MMEWALGKTGGRGATAVSHLPKFPWEERLA